MEQQISNLPAARSSRAEITSRRAIFMLYEDRSLFSDNVQIWGRGVFSAVFYFFVINHKEIGFAETISFPYICFEGKRLSSVENNSSL